MPQMTPRPAQWIESAPIKVRASREMAATPDEVWVAVADHAGWPEWFTSIERAEATGGSGVGSTRSVFIRSWRLDEEFVEWEAPALFGFTVVAADGPIGRLAESLNERIEIQVLASDRVRVTYLQGWQPRSRVTGLMLRGAARRVGAQLRSALSTLEARIEAGRNV